MKDIRQANIEALRCFAMFFIVLNHCILNMATTKLSLKLDTVDFCLINLIYPIVYTGVNIFVLISGYFLVETKRKNTNWSKVFKLWITVLFYSVGIFLLFALINNESVSLKDLIHSVMPIRYDAYWFITQYIGLYILSPFLAKWAYSMSKVEYKTMLISFFIITSILQLQGLKGGFSLIWFVFLYMFSGYIRRFETESATIIKWNEKSWSVFASVTCLLIIMSFLINGDSLNIVSYFGFYNGPLLFVSSVSIFLIFKKIKDTKFITTIAKLSPYMLGVYLIHEHPVLKEYLWSFLNNNILNLHFYNLIIVAILIMLICVIIEYTRQIVFRFLKIDNLIQKVIDKMSEVIQKGLRKFETV